MYTVLIAEDEMLVRMGLAASVLWEKLDMQVVADAADGQKAYELFVEKKPDIVITDLSMPGMDGITLIRNIRASGEKCAVIVVTCMDHFDLLHEAMELDVVAYLVKVTMSISDIHRALLKARESLGAPRPRLHDPQHVARASSAFEAYLLDKTLTSKQLRERAEREGFDVLPDYYLYVVYLRSSQTVSWQLQNALKGMLLEQLKNQHVLQVLKQEECLIALFTRSPKVHEMIRRGEAFRNYVRDSFNLQLTLGISIEALDVAELPQRLSDMRAVCDAMPEPAILWFDARGHLADTHMKAEFAQLREALWHLCDYDFAYGAVVRAYELEEAFTRNAALFTGLAYQLASLLWDRADISPEQRTVLEKGLREAGNPSGVLQYIFRYAVERLPVYRQEIRMVISFVIRHPEGDLSLKHVATLVSLHPQYLSNLFKRETGVNYSDFVCATRLLAAQRILREGNQSVQQISDALGFSDQAYFCRKFKQLTGKTPALWRRSNT